MRNHILPVLLFIGICLAITLPLSSGKYIFTLDSITSPSAIHGVKSIEDFIHGAYLTYPNRGELGLDAASLPKLIVLGILKQFISTSLLQKAEIFLMFFLSMLSMYMLMRGKPMTRIFAAVFYAVNPFTYMRFIAGHWNLLFAYALLPWFILELMRKERRPIRIAVLLSIITVFSLHMTIIAGIAMLIFMRKKDVTAYSITAVIYLLINAYWIFTMFSAATIAISPLGNADVLMFDAENSAWNHVATLLTLHGFWRQDAYLLTPLWLVIPGVLILLYLAVHGYIVCKDKYKHRFLMLGLAGLILALATTTAVTDTVFRFLYEMIPVFKGFREPQKFLVLLCISYAYLAAQGLSAIPKKVRAAALILPFLLTPFLFIGNQIIPVDYPADYYEMNAFLNEDNDDANVLFLPWHLYLDFSWIENRDKRIANPAAIFFDKPTIRGDNMELGFVYSHSSNPISAYVVQNLNESITKLSLINVKYVLVAKEFNTSVKDGVLIKETEHLLLYKNPMPTAKVYASDDLKRLYPLTYTKENAASYTLNTTSRKYILFTAGYDRKWKLGGQEPMQGYPINVYENRNGTRLRYENAFLSIITFI